MTVSLYPQSPITVGEVVRLFGELEVPWWIAGGWAIDLFLGHQTRDHEDIDVVVLRRDQRVVHDVLSGWDVHVADPPGTLRPLRTGEWLEVGQHDIWCRKSPTEPWSLWVMLNESEDDLWVFRRDPGVKLPLATIVKRTSDGVPFLAPEVQLLFQSQAPPTEG